MPATHPRRIPRGSTHALASASVCTHVSTQPSTPQAQPWPSTLLSACTILFTLQGGWWLPHLCCHRMNSNKAGLVASVSTSSPLTPLTPGGPVEVVSTPEG